MLNAKMTFDMKENGNVVATKVIGNFVLKIVDYGGSPWEIRTYGANGICIECSPCYFELADAEKNFELKADKLLKEQILNQIL